MSVLVSFLNVGEIIASSAEQFLLFGADVEENSEIVTAFIRKLVHDLEILENNIYDISVMGQVKKIEFKVTELPNDMKMLSYLGGELSNASTYFSTFGNVKSADSNDFRKTFGVSKTNFWKPFPYEKRVSDAEKAVRKYEELEKLNLAQSTKRSKLTSFISNELKSRQLKFPLIGKFIDMAKAEPLHLKNNTVKERFMCLFRICVSQSKLQSVKCYKEISAECLFYKFVNFIKTTMNCNFLSKKIVRWFNDNLGKTEKDFTFRFRGKESLMYLRHFPILIQLLIANISDKGVLKRLHQIHFQSIHLRYLLSYSVRISDFSQVDLDEMKKEAHLLFKACCLFDPKVTPSLCTLWNIGPFNDEQCFKSYRPGLSCNTMEGREQKHSKISKYAENTTIQNRWPMIFRHEFIHLVYLRENGYDNINYKKKSSNYIPYCHLEFKPSNSLCVLCDGNFMAEIKKFAEG